MTNQTKEASVAAPSPPVPTADKPGRDTSAAEALRIDVGAATAALALAVASAKRPGPQPDADETGRGPPGGRPVRKPAGAVMGDAMRRHGIWAAAVLLALAAGWSGARLNAQAPDSEPQWGATAAALHETREDLTRLTGDVKTLKVAIDSLKESVDRSRSESSTRQAQVVERLKGAERAPQEASARIQQIGVQLDRIESAAKEPAARFAALGERLDRIERQIAIAAPKPVAAAPSAAPAGPAASAVGQEPASHTGSVEPKSRDVPVDGWVLHEVSNGVALIESRNRRLIEVGPGEMVPGVGRVEAIERRGKRWVVVTARGIIGAVR